MAKATGDPAKVSHLPHTRVVHTLAADLAVKSIFGKQALRRCFDRKGLRFDP